MFLFAQHRTKANSSASSASALGGYVKLNQDGRIENLELVIGRNLAAIGQFSIVRFGSSPIHSAVRPQVCR
jgi:hypothetical protein